MIENKHIVKLFVLCCSLTIGMGLLIYNESQQNRSPASVKIIEVPKEVIVTKEIKKDLKQYYFFYSDDKLTSDSMKNLEGLVNIIKNRPNGKYEIHAYTDNIGPIEYNYNLSKKRANAILALIKSFGIETQNIGLYYHGISHQNNQTEEGRQKNRRVDFYIYEESSI